MRELLKSNKKRKQRTGKAPLRLRFPLDRKEGRKEGEREMCLLLKESFIISLQYLQSIRGCEEEEGGWKNPRPFNFTHYASPHTLRGRPTNQGNGTQTRGPEINLDFPPRWLPGL